MHRLAINISRRGHQIPIIPNSLFAPRSRGLSSLHNRTYATSSPKEAEEASAQSGGSRSKDAAEEAHDQSEGLSSKDATMGRTGGGEPLSSSKNPPPRPKIHNASVPGTGKDKLTKEQQEEVDRHNAEFDKKHDRASSATDDKVDKGFWSGNGGKDGR